MSLKAKVGLVILFAILFGVLALLAFLGTLAVYMLCVPEPLSSALSDLNYFAPLVGVGALILGLLQAVLNLWLYQFKWVAFWLVNIILALVLGGLASFFSIWPIWTVIGFVNLFLVWVYTILLEWQLNKETKDMPT